MKIRQYLSKLQQKNQWHFFSGYGVRFHCFVTRLAALSRQNQVLSDLSAVYTVKTPQVCTCHEACRTGCCCDCQHQLTSCWRRRHVSLTVIAPLALLVLIFRTIYRHCVSTPSSAPSLTRPPINSYAWLLLPCLAAA